MGSREETSAGGLGLLIDKCGQVGARGGGGVLRGPTPACRLGPAGGWRGRRVGEVGEWQNSVGCTRNSSARCDSAPRRRRVGLHHDSALVAIHWLAARCCSCWTTGRRCSQPWPQPDNLTCSPHCTPPPPAQRAGLPEPVCLHACPSSARLSRVKTVLLVMVLLLLLLLPRRAGHSRASRANAGATAVRPPVYPCRRIDRLPSVQVCIVPAL